MSALQLGYVGCKIILWYLFINVYKYFSANHDEYIVEENVFSHISKGRYWVRSYFVR